MKEPAPKLSPVMQQYLDMKTECPGAVLLFRLGDFYESFFNDAKIVSRALELVLTHRGADERGADIPMCGIPWHAAENYLGRLVRAGHRVAIAEQMETPEEAKSRGHKQIERKIIRILTPGTLTDDNLLSPKTSNFLVAVHVGANSIRPQNEIDKGVCHTPLQIVGCDISTGELFYDAPENLASAIAKINPAEIIYPEELAESPEIAALRETYNTTPVHRALYDRFDRDDISSRTLGIKPSAYPDAADAIALMAGYLDNTQRGARAVFRMPYRLGSGQTLSVDPSTWASLEIDKPMQSGGVTLLDILDKTVTASGGRKLRACLRNLSGDIDEISRRHATIEHLISNRAVRENIRNIMSNVPDIERAISRLVANRGMPRDMVSVKEFLNALPDLQRVGRDMGSDFAARFEGLDLCADLAEILRRAMADSMPAFFRDGGVIRAGFDQALDNTRKLSHGGRELIAALQSDYIAQTGINTLKIKYNNILGYFVEVPANRADPMMARDSGFIHRQTLVGNMRFTTSRLIDLDNEVRSASDRAAGIESEIINDLIARILDHSKQILAASDLIADADTWAAMAECAFEYNWVRPTMSADTILDIRGGRHPVVEFILRGKHGQFVKNDCILGIVHEGIRHKAQGISENESALCPMPYAMSGNQSNGCAIALITGPNMAGKSTYLRQNALIVILAHLGSFVPADSAHIGIVDQLFSRVGASDNLAAGQSTFMVEMQETANILNRATNKSFIIFDEIGRGTATFDGMSIAQAVLEFLNHLRARTLFATHYHELTALADGVGANNIRPQCITNGNNIPVETPQGVPAFAGMTNSPLRYVKNLTVEVREHKGEIIFMHRVVPGVADRSYGIHVAKMAGMPESVVNAAEIILTRLEQGEGVSVSEAAHGNACNATKSTVGFYEPGVKPSKVYIVREEEPVLTKPDQMKLF